MPRLPGRSPGKFSSAWHGPRVPPDESSSRRCSGLASESAWPWSRATLAIFASVTEWGDQSRVQRVVFTNIPGTVQAVFYTTLPLLFVVAGWLFFQRIENWERGQPDRRATTRKNLKRRIHDLRAGVYMQTLMRDPAAGIMHSLIYFPFLILFAVTTVDEINHVMPAGAKFLHGGVYQGYAAGGQRGRDRVSARHRLGHRPPLRAPPLPAAAQDQARGRPDPGHVLRPGGDGLHHQRAADPAAGPAGVREVAGARLPVVGAARRVVPSSAVGRAPVVVDRPCAGVLRPGRPGPDHQVAAHVHLARSTSTCRPGTGPRAP